MSYISTRLTGARSIAVEAVEMSRDIAPGDVRLALGAASLCGTDLHYYRHFENAGFRMQRPTTLGHEACGIVEDPNGSGLEAGQLVALNPIIACGTCGPCRAGQMNYCANKRFPGSATVVPHIDGFFRERFDMPARCCRPVAPGTKPEHLTFAEPLACTLHALETSGVTAGCSVLVLGCGPMGLLAVAAAAAKGAEVSAMDLRADPVAVAVKLGAREGLVAGETDPASLENRFDVVIEASGSPRGFNGALAYARRQGTVSLLSNIQPTEAVIDLHRIMLKELKVVGSFQFNAEFETAVRMVESGAIDVGAMIAARFPVARVGEALELMLSGEAAGKIVIDGAG